MNPQDECVEKSWIFSRSLILIPFILGVALGGRLEAKAERWVLINPSLQKIEAMPIKVISRLQIGSDFFVTVDTGLGSKDLHSTQAGMQKLMAGSRAAGIHPDFPIHLIADSSKIQPSPPIFSEKWWLQEFFPRPINQVPSSSKLAWHLERLHFAQLPLDRTGGGITVGILDTGIDLTHSQLRDQIWRNSVEIPANGVDDDGNGFIDDVQGYNFVDNDPYPIDRHSHGTHVAGLVAAHHYGIGGGIAPDAKVMAVKIIAENSSSFLSQAAQGIIYAVDNGAQILSNSWRVYRGDTNQEPSDKNLDILKAAIRYAEQRGVLFVTAAGNESLNIDEDGPEIYPAQLKGFANLIVVASSDRHDDPSIFTNFGVKTVHLAAPGTAILSTIPGNGWREMSGTSMSTPLVAGVLARGMSGGLDGLFVLQRALATADMSSGFAGKIQSGIVNPVAILAP